VVLLYLNRRACTIRVPLAAKTLFRFEMTRWTPAYVPELHVVDAEDDEEAV
jgi:hypothetical protein